MTVVLVAVLGRNRVIGAGGDQPFSISEDQRRFKRLTMGSVVVMGRKTYDAMGGALPGRRNVVITRSRAWSAPDVTVVHSLAEALQVARAGGGPLDTDVFVIGGAQIYTQAMPLADRLELTEVDQAPQGDTFFPPVPEAEWQVAQRDERDGYAFVTYRRARDAGSEGRENG